VHRNIITKNIYGQKSH